MGTPLGNEIDRLREENKHLRELLEYWLPKEAPLPGIVDEKVKAHRDKWWEAYQLVK